MSDNDEALFRIAEARDTGATTLDLSAIQLTSLPEELAKLTKLHVLVLGRHFCHKTLSFLGQHQLFTDLSLLAALTGLRELNLKECSELTDVSPLAALTGLQTLDLSGCYKLTDVSPLAALTGLRELNLRSCHALTDVSPLAFLSDLQTLVLTACSALTNVSPLAALAGLRRLFLDLCGVLTDVSALAALTGLQTLDLRDCWGPIADRSAPAFPTGLQTLDLSGWNWLTDVSPLAALSGLRKLSLWRCSKLTDVLPLAALTGLWELDLRSCSALTDVSPLAALTDLRKLDLSECRSVTNMSPLAALTSLRRLDITMCYGLRQFGRLRDLLPQLEHLFLYGSHFDDLRPEVCGTNRYESVLDAVRAHCADSGFGLQHDDELKVFVLGNGGVGKTQLCRRILNLPFDEERVRSTHGVQLEHIVISLSHRAAPVCLNLWDFGGQEIYHGTHGLFLQGQAIFVIVWTPETEAGEYQDGGVMMRHHPLVYWLEYVHSVAGTACPILVIQGKCDSNDDKQPMPDVPEVFSALRSLEFSAKEDKDGKKLNKVLEALKDAAGVLLDHPMPEIPVGRVKLARTLRDMRKEDQKRPADEQHRNRSLSTKAFRRLCEENGRINMNSWREALMFLHHRGVVLWRPDLFKGRIILDQSWALEAIYAVLDRTKTPLTLSDQGRFTRKGLSDLVWKDSTDAEQQMFLGMMESCGICFCTRELNSGKYPPEWEYIAPELLPARESHEVQRLLEGRIPSDPAPTRVQVQFPFPHEGILRRFLSWLGTHVGDKAVYWKYGCWFYEPGSDVRVLIDTRRGSDPTHPWRGVVGLDAWGWQSMEILEPLIDKLAELSPVQKPRIERIGFAECDLPPGVPERNGEYLFPEYVVISSAGERRPVPLKLAQVQIGTLERWIRFAEAWRACPADKANATELCRILKTQGLHVTPDAVSHWKCELENCFGKLTEKAPRGKKTWTYLQDTPERLDEIIKDIRIIIYTRREDDRQKS